MSQTDLNVANGSGSAVRSDLNNHLAALGTLSSGASAPSTTFANMWWADTTNNVLYRRNNGDSAWLIQSSLNQPNRVASYSAGPVTHDLGHYSATLACDASSGGFTINLLAAATAGSGFITTIFKTDSSTNIVTIDGSGTETINGLQQCYLTRQRDSVTLVCDGSNWLILSDQRDMSFFAHRNAVDQTTITTATWTKVQINDDSTAPGFDQATDFTTGTYVWTCRVPGVYAFHGQVAMTAIDDGDFARCAIYKGASPLVYGSTVRGGASHTAYSNVSFVGEFAVADTVFLYAYHTSSSTVDILGDSFATFLSGYRVR